MAFEVLIGVARNADTATITNNTAVRMTGAANGNGTVFLRADPDGFAEKDTTFLHIRSKDAWIHVEGATVLQFTAGNRLVNTPILSMKRLDRD